MTEPLISQEALNALQKWCADYLPPDISKIKITIDADSRFVLIKLGARQSIPVE